MKNWRKNILGNKTIFVLLIFALLIAQTFKLHLHIEHENTPLTDTEIHTVDVHAASYLHETNHDSNHHNDIQQHHNSIDIDVDLTTNNIVKKVQLLNPFVLFVFTLFIILCAPQLRQTRSWYQEIKPRAFSYCSPPQRAPPTV